MKNAIVLLAALGALGVRAEETALPAAARPVENVKSWVMPRLTASIERIGENEAHHFDCVMVGDSITECWKYGKGGPTQKKMLGDFSILNLGISGDTTANVLWRFDQGVLDGYTADLFQIMIGSNNGGNDSPDDMKAAVGEIIRRIRAKHPESKVLLLPIFYVRGGHACRANVLRDKRNAKLKELADGETVVWHDFNARFYDQPDNISTNVFYDGQHPNVRAHEIWAEEVRPFIAKAVAEAKAKRRTVTVEVGPGADLAAAVREVNAKRKPGDRGEIVLADGTYPLAQTVELGPKASFITIRAKNPGKATVVGGEAVRGADFKTVTDEAILRRLPAAARGKARAYRPADGLKRAFEEGRHTGSGNWTYRDWNNYAANRPRGRKDFEYPTFPCLTVDARRQELARWPNGRDWCWIGASNLVYTAKDGKNARIVTGTGREKGWTFANQKIAAAGWINAWRYLNWCTDVTRAEGSDELVLTESKINTAYARTYFFNVPEEMDEPGEWCYDGTSGQVLLFPPEGFGDESLCAFGTTRDVLFHMTGDGISIRDLVVTAKVFHPAVVIENDAAGNEIRGCRFSGIGYDCIWMAGRRNVVRDCDLEDIVSMGIGVQGGDVKTMLPHLNRVENNVIRRAEILCTTWAKGGIYVDGVGNRVAHNEVTDMVDGGIYFAGYGHILEYNRVYDVCREFDDVGSVYSPGGGRCYGNVFRYNDISGAPGQGVVLYYDDTTSGHEAYGNILRNAGHDAILVGGGRDNNIHDNLILGGFTAIEMDNRGLHWPAYTKRSEEEMRRSFAEKWNLTNRTEAICRKYPKFAAWLTSPLPLYSYAGNRFERNVIVDPAGYASALVIGKGKTIDPTNTVFSGNVVYRTRGPQAGRDLVLHPENVATNEYSARIPVRPPIGECRVVDGTPEKPLDLGFADLPPPAFDPWPYMGYAPQNWVDRAQLYALRRENFKSLNVRPWRKGDLTLKPGSLLDRENHGLRSIPFDKIGPQRGGNKPGVTLLDGGRVLVNANRFGVKERLFAGAVVSNDFTLTTRRTAHCVLAKAVLPEAVEPRLQIDYAYGFGPDATVTVRVREWQTVEGEIATPTGTVYFTSVFSSYPARYGLFDGAREPHTFTHEIRAKGCVGYFHENYYSSAGDTLQVRTGFSDRGVAEAAAFLAAEMPSFDEPAPKFIGLGPDANDPLPRRAPVTDNPTAANIQRTMAKLEASTAESPATVRVLFYGQSITFQLWSAHVIEELKRRYPTVNFIVRNEAIGGYGTDMLFQTMETDIFPFYPDLLVFHDYGDPRDGYLRILNEVRRRTTAEIALCSSHLRRDETATNIVAILAGERKNGKWDRDALAADRTVKIRSVATDLGTLYVDLQGKWCRTLIDNGWESKKLLRDSVHLNPLGIAYYSAFYADELVRRPELKPGEMSGSIREEPFATRLEFTGNRVAAVSDGTGDPDATAEVWLDGKRVGDAATLRMWGMTRPSTVINWFPGLVGASFEKLPVDEFWTLTILPDDPKDEEQTLPMFYRRKKPPMIKPIRYRVEGTVTGFDGEGSSARDFVSKSGRVKIPADAFMDFYEWPKQRPPAGTRILWRTYPLFAETYRTRPRGVETVLVQGCANARHVLELRNVKGRLGIARFVVNEPTHRELPQTSFVVTARPGEDLRAVRDRVRRERAADEPAEVILEDGVYEVKDELVLDSLRDARTTWRAKNPGKAIFVGGPTVSGSSFRPVTNAAILARLPAAARGKVRALPVPERIRGNFHKGALGHIRGAIGHRSFRRPETCGSRSEPRPCKSHESSFCRGGARSASDQDLCLPVLTVDTKFMMPAAWPNGEKFLWTDAEKGDPRIASWDWSDADIYTWGFHGRAFDYRTQRLSVGWNAASNTVDFGKTKVGPTARYRFINVLEELDAPGEWCYHVPTGTVLLYPPEGFGSSSRCTLGTFRDHFFAVRADDVTLDGLVFTAKPGYQAVAVDSCRGVRVTNCRFSGIDGHAVYLDGAENVIRDCTFEDITSSAVQVRGGDPETLTAASNVVENCRLRHLNFLENGMFHSAIRMYGCGHYVRHNEIEDTMEQAIGFHARNSVVEYNRCRDCCKEYGDANVIGTGGSWAPGSVIRYNDVGGCAGFTEGIYIDDCASDVTVYGNVIHDVGHFGIFLGGGQRNVISNNVVIGGWGGIHTDNRGITWPQWKKVRDEKGLYALAPVNSVFVNNLIYDNSGYGSHLGLAKKLFPPDGTNVFAGNLVVRPVGLRPGCSDIQSGESANAPANRLTATTTNRTDRPIGPVRILDGTPESPIDIGFRHVPKPAFEPRGYMLESFAWVDVDRLAELRAADALGRQTDTGDYSLKPDARLLREIPGFQPIPWEKIGIVADIF